MKKVLLVILTSYVGSACADNNAFYVGLKIGKNLSSSQSVSSSMSSVMTTGTVTTKGQGSAEEDLTNSLGAVSTLNFGYYFNDLPIRAEVAYSLYGGFSDEIDSAVNISSTITYPDGKTSAISSSFDVKNKFSTNVNTLMFNGYYDVKTNLPIYPYVMAGVGFSFNKISTEITLTNSLKKTTQYEDKGFKLGFAFGLGAGVAYDFNVFGQNLAVDLGINYTNSSASLETIKPESSVTGNTTLSNTFTNLISLGGSTDLTLGLRYSF